LITFFLLFFIEGSEFSNRSEVVDKHIMAGNEKCVDGGQKTGATAIYITSEMGYDNTIDRDEEGNIVRIQVSGTGGRTINIKTNKYEQSFNQPLSLNLAMLTSAQHQLPVRVLLKVGVKILYLGLWVITKCEYDNKSDNDLISWVFTLCKAKAKK
jgi:hypothetical protein